MGDTPSSAGQLNLLSDQVLDDLVREIDSPASIPKPRELLTEIREFHGWTVSKLDALEFYLKLYRRVAGSGAFIDAFAATGRGSVTKRGTESEVDGSALIAAKSGAFASLDLIELDPMRFSALEESLSVLTSRQRAKVHTHNGDCNKLIPDILASGDLDPNKPCFVLLDQDSTQLEWSTIERISTWKTYEPPEKGNRPKRCKAEMWILFNTNQVLQRLWPNDRSKHPMPISPETLDRLLGGRAAWIDLWEANQPFSFVVSRFSELLRGLGYRYAIPQVILDPATGRPQYHMFHVTDHPSAVTLMRWAKRTSSGYETQTLPIDGRSQA